MSISYQSNLDAALEDFWDFGADFGEDPDPVNLPPRSPDPYFFTVSQNTSFINKSVHRQYGSDIMNPNDPISLKGKAAKQFDEYNNRKATKEEIERCKRSEEFFDQWLQRKRKNEGDDHSLLL